jgi:hypothetical protein
MPRKPKAPRPFHHANAYFREDWKLPRKGVYVLLAGYNKPLRLSDESDTEIERARRHVERVLGKPLPLSTKTDYPEFTLYVNGEEIGGG